MKKILVSFTVLCLTLMSCNSIKSTENKSKSIAGAWKLNYITGPRITFEGLYPNKKPTINFDLKENRVFGNNSCNQYSGALLVNGNAIDFKKAKLLSTMMACEGIGETTYMKTLEKIDSYSISEDGKTLNFIMGDVAMMRFEKVMTKE